MSKCFSCAIFEKIYRWRRSQMNHGIKISLQAFTKNVKLHKKKCMQTSITLIIVQRAKKDKRKRRFNDTHAFL